MSINTIRRISPLELLDGGILEDIYLYVIKDHGYSNIFSLLLVSTSIRDKLQTFKIQQELVIKALCVLPGDTPPLNFMVSGWVEKWNDFRRLQYDVLSSEWFTFRTYKRTMIHIFSSILSNLYQALNILQKSSDRTTGDIEDRVQIHYINMTLMQHNATRVIGYLQGRVEDAFNDMQLMQRPLSTSKTIYTGCPDFPTFELNPVTLELKVIPALAIQVQGGIDYPAAPAFPNSAYEHNLAPRLRGPWAQNNLLPCFLPRQLLRGPWTEEKLDLLHILRLRCLDVAPIDQCFASEGLMDALKEHNMRAVDLLIPEMSLQLCPRIPDGATHMAPIPNACVHLNVSVNRHHLNYAIERMGCEPRVLQRLIFAAPNRMHKFPKFWDVKNVRWVYSRAGKKGRRRNKRANWLEKCLERTGDHTFSLSEKD